MEISVKSGFNKVICYLAIFLAASVLTFLSMALDDETANSLVMTDATLPVIMVQNDDEIQYNPMHGYTGEVKQELLNLYLTPLDDDKLLDIVINTYGQDITAISYKIREAQTLSLIEKTDVEQWQNEDNGSRIFAQLRIKNLLDSDTPYILEITLTTPKYESVKYYTKIICGTSYDISDKLDFILDFNEATFDSERRSEFGRKLETKSQSDESNYGKVNINNSKALVGWDTLSPFAESSVVPVVYDLYSDIAVMGLEYTIGAQNSHGAYDTYTVSEYYRVRETKSNMYLLSFDRETTQIFDVDNDLLSNGRINLGVNPYADVDTITSANENFACYVANGIVWCFDSAQNMFTKVFSFEAQDSDNIRERYKQHNIKLISVDNDGNCNFMVSGYMNRGAHEGQLGISLYNYNYKEDHVTEMLFIPSDEPYEVLAENVGEIAYVNNNNIFYLMADDCLYSIDLISKEIMTEISGLAEGNYKVSDSGTIIAYTTNSKVYDADEIRIFNMEKINDYYIKAGDGDKLRPLGFIESDFIYGLAHNDDIFIESDESITFAMYAVKIINQEYSIIKEYQQENVYMSDVVVDKLRVNLYRVNKNEDGSYTAISADQLINHNENSEKQGAVVSTITTEAKKKEVVLKFAKAGAANISTVIRTVGEIEYTAKNTIELPKQIEGTDRYYIYKSGRFCGSKKDFAEAVELAGSEMSIITDADNVVVWKKYKSSSASIKGVAVPENVSYESIKTAIKGYSGSLSDRQVRADGVSVTDMLVFISEGNPVMAKTAGGYALITGYDTKTITYIDCVSKASNKVSYSEAESIFAAGGNLFISCY